MEEILKMKKQLQKKNTENLSIKRDDFNHLMMNF